jgi:RimJ/RimL family protein N-acetyltransferase
MLPLQKFFDYVQSEPNYFIWIAREDENSIGAAFMEVDPNQAQSFGFMVNPELRGRGYGQSVLHTLMAQPETALVVEWKVGIEPDNIASQRCVAPVGFVPQTGLMDEAQKMT